MVEESEKDRPEREIAQRSDAVLKRLLATPPDHGRPPKLKEKS
jgi:hypothetical protein